MAESTPITRRTFVKTAAAAAAASAAFPYFATGAENDKKLRIGLVGCGGRGTGAAKDAMAADPNVKVVALADLYKERVDQCRTALKGKTEIEDKMCFSGMDAYKKLLATDVDYVILATPPYYRPKHLPEAIAAGKHVFMEKPVAVDPVGVRIIIQAGEQAKSKGLSIVAGTQRRHQKGYVETIKKIHDGAIGKILSAQAYWNGGQLWFKRREAGWSDMDWMHRDWVNWRWLSGDHIVEQHVHNLDVINWVLGTHPVKVVGMGGRHRRVTGDQFDFFSCDFEFPDNVHVISQCRQINGCANDVSERVIGTKGVSNCNGWISTTGNEEYKGARNPYEQEHADLMKAIRSGEALNEAKQVAESTLCGIMARESAYTGKAISWDEIMKSNLVLAPPEYELSDENIAAGVIKAHIARPGVV
jgi:myo-inositol 2-dehydrogenase / D-chiro-inositol 1-dehydrogenase